MSGTFEIGSDEYLTASDRRDKRRYRACEALPSLINNAGQKKMREATRPFQPFKKLLSSLVAEVRDRCGCSIFLRRGYCIRRYFLCIQASHHPRSLLYAESNTGANEADYARRTRLSRECTPKRVSRQIYQTMATVLQPEPRSLGISHFEAWRGGQRISLTPQCVVKETQRLWRKRPDLRCRYQKLKLFCEIVKFATSSLPLCHLAGISISFLPTVQPSSHS